MADTNLCPCSSGLDSNKCCIPYVQGKAKAPTAEALLRSRYTAFTLAEVDYILATHHSRTRSEVKREEIEEWAKNSDWLGLKIVEIEKGQKGDEAGTIIFSAHYRNRADGKEEMHWEKSFFEKEGGDWRFVDAQGIKQGTIKRTEPKIGRNDPCTCGSGKKYKKCCGAAA